MKRSTGNQHKSKRRDLLALLDYSLAYLREGAILDAQVMLKWYREWYAQAPASTRRRWRCGR